MTASATAPMTAVVAGVSGAVGWRIAELLVRRGARVVGLSRTAVTLDGVESLAVDLEDRDDCRARLGCLTDATHLFFAAQIRGGTVARNTALLANLLDALEPVAPRLAHVHLVHGTKYYGSHLGPFRTPAREDDPRHEGGDFYFDQQDLVAARQPRRSWTYSISRPHTFCDTRPALRNLPRLIALYAVILRELGEPLWFPGTAGNFHALYQCTDIVHLAGAIVWMATEPRCANQAFNVTNGDVIRWVNLWPRFARWFDMAPGAVRTVSLAAFMADKEAVWQRVVARHRLIPTKFDETALWSYGDYVFTPGWDIMSDTNKIRRHGFHELVDTEAMFLRCFEQMRTEKLIP